MVKYPKELFLESKNSKVDSISRKYGEDASKRETEFYKFNGVLQSKRKSEAWEAAKRITKERGIVNYNPDLHLKGVQMGQKVLQTYRITGLDREWAGGEDTPAHKGWKPGTDIIGLEGDDLNYENNPAMQQCYDDMRRTCINGLNLAHETIERRFGKEVTPESINLYLEMLNHNIGAGAIVMEHTAETNPELVKDSYAKVFTGNDELADAIDDQFLIDINKMFPKYQADQIKAEVGDRIFQVARIPTMAVRTSDGGLSRAWVGQQASLAFLCAYDIPAGDAVTSDFVFTIKHGDVVFMGTQLPYRRAQRQNSAGGMALGFYSDTNQTSRTPEGIEGLDGGLDPVKVIVEALTPGCVITDQGWLHNYMAGGSSGWSNYIISVYTDEVLEDYGYHGAIYAMEKWKCGVGEVPNTFENMMAIAEEVSRWSQRGYDNYPGLMEAHFGGSQRYCIQSAASGAAVGAMTGDPDLGNTAWCYNTPLAKEHYLRLGFYGHDMQDQMMMGHNYSYRSDQGLPYEFRGPAYPDFAMHVGHMGGYIGIIAGAAHARGAAYSTNPMVKIAFADPNLQFDFRYPRREYGIGGLRQFMPAGERDAVIPPH